MNHNGDKPSLPSIKDLLEGGPGLIDYSPTINTNSSGSRIHSHRRHASEHILSNNYIRSSPPIHHPITIFEQQSNNNNVISSIPIISPPSSNVSSLPFEMQSLSLDKRKIIPTADKKHILLNVNHQPVTMTTSSSSTTTNNRRRTHSRSFSDFTHPYPRQLLSDTTTTSVPTSPTSDVNSSIVVEESTRSPPTQYDTEEEELEDTPTPTMTHHTAGGKYICPYCDKGFTRPSSLRTHTYSHTGEKPFKCTEPHCGRKFSVQSNLRRHLRIHRLNKPSTLFLSKNIK